MTTFVTVPLTLNYLGDERYGMWMTMSSLVAMLGFADLGVGNGLVNAVSRAFGRNDRREAAECVSSAFFGLAAIASLGLLVFVLVCPVVPWNSVPDVDSEVAAPKLGPQWLS